MHRKIYILNNIYNKDAGLLMRKKIGLRFTLLLLVFTLILISSVIATEQSLGTFQKNACLDLKQTCGNCTWINVTSVSYPNGTTLSFNAAMADIGGGIYINHTCSHSSIIGHYTYDTLGNPDGSIVSQPVGYDITESGDTFDLTQGFFIIGLIGIIALFVAIGLSFSKEKWKIRSLFFMAALFMGIILLNSIRIMAGSSIKLSSMAGTGLIVGIIVLSFMFLYMLIYYTIELFKYFKEKKRMRWEVSTSSQ